MYKLLVVILLYIIALNTCHGMELHHVHRHHAVHHQRHHRHRVSMCGVGYRHDHYGVCSVVAVTVTVTNSIPIPRADDRGTLHGKDFAMQGSLDRTDLPSVNRLRIEDLAIVSSIQYTQEYQMDWAPLVIQGFTVFGVVMFAWYVGKYGFQAVGTGVTKLFSVARTDFAALEARVTGLELMVVGQTTSATPPIAPVPSVIASTPAVKSS